MKVVTRWGFAVMAALAVASTGCDTKRKDADEASRQGGLDAAAATAAAPTVPVPPTPPPIPATTGPSCDMSKMNGPCFETLADWTVAKTGDKTACEIGGASYSASACSRAGSFGMCNASAGFMGRVMFFYKTTQVLDQAGARTMCEGTFHGSFTPIAPSAAPTAQARADAVDASAASTPSSASPTPTGRRDLSPSEARKLEKAGGDLDRLLKK